MTYPGQPDKDWRTRLLDLVSPWSRTDPATLSLDQMIRVDGRVNAWANEQSRSANLVDAGKGLNS